MSFVSYAQNFEDVLLWRALKHIEGGFYIDVGAAWPEQHSVTHAFYSRGWTGINIEPSPELYAQLHGTRDRDINLQIAVSDRIGQVDLSVFAGTGLSTVKDSVAKEHIERNYSCERVTVPTLSLADIWSMYVPAEQNVHFLKIDVEGSETEVVRGNDWGRYRPWVVIIESTYPMSQEDASETWEGQLLDAGYKFAYFDGLNRFYVENGHLDLLGSLRIPPNVFDEFVSVAEFAAQQSRDRLEEKVAEVEALVHEREMAVKSSAARLAAAESQAVAALQSESYACELLDSTRLSLAVLDRECAQLRTEVSVLRSSLSWQLTYPLREAGRLGLEILRVLRQARSKTSKRGVLDSLATMLPWVANSGSTESSVRNSANHNPAQGEVSVQDEIEATSGTKAGMSHAGVPVDRKGRLQKIVHGEIDRLYKARA